MSFFCWNAESCLFSFIDSLTISHESPLIRLFHIVLVFLLTLPLPLKNMFDTVIVIVVVEMVIIIKIITNNWEDSFSQFFSFYRQTFYITNITTPRLTQYVKRYWQFCSHTLHGTIALTKNYWVSGLYTVWIFLEGICKWVALQTLYHNFKSYCFRMISAHSLLKYMCGCIWVGRQSWRFKLRSSG
jgi:hypothetical protein